MSLAKPTTQADLETAREAATAFDWHVENGLDQVWSDTPLALLDQVPVKALFADNPVAVSPAPQTALKSPATASPSEPQKFVASPDLASLYQQIRDFEGCDLKDTAINTVIADGNPDAKIMLIGEAPGADEDRQGVPFVGPPGQLLDKMLLAIGLDRTKILISNMVFWRPPGNRKPTPQETEMCLQFTRRHIELVNPEILVFVGALSAQKLLDTGDGITRLRGKWAPYKLRSGSEVQCMPLLHPAYLLRQPRYKRETWIDLLELKKKVIELGL